MSNQPAIVGSTLTHPAADGIDIRAEVAGGEAARFGLVGYGDAEAVTVALYEVGDSSGSGPANVISVSVDSQGQGFLEVPTTPSHTGRCWALVADPEGAAEAGGDYETGGVPVFESGSPFEARLCVI